MYILYFFSVLYSDYWFEAVRGYLPHCPRVGFQLLGFLVIILPMESLMQISLSIFVFFGGGVVTLRGTWQVWMHAASVPGSHAVVRAVEEWQEWESPDSPCLAMLRLKIRQNMSNEFFPTHARAFAGQASRAYSFHLISWHVWFIMGFIIVDPRADQRLD